MATVARLGTSDGQSLSHGRCPQSHQLLVLFCALRPRLTWPLPASRSRDSTPGRRALPHPDTSQGLATPSQNRPESLPRPSRLPGCQRGDPRRLGGRRLIIPKGHGWSLRHSEASTAWGADPLTCPPFPPQSQSRPTAFKSSLRLVALPAFLSRSRRPILVASASAAPLPLAVLSPAAEDGAQLDWSQSPPQLPPPHAHTRATHVCSTGVHARTHVCTHARTQAHRHT